MFSAYISTRRNQMASERVKEKAGEIKRDGWYCLLEYLLQQADCVLRLRVKSFWTSKTPKNYTALSPFLTLSLQLTITPYLPPSLPSGLSLPAWISLLCFVTCTCLRAVFTTWVVLQRNGIPLSPFLHWTTLPASCRFISQHLNLLNAVILQFPPLQPIIVIVKLAVTGITTATALF